jgi:hypothetical protein
MTLLGLVWVATSANAQLAGVGEPIDPHGFPAYYQDTNNLQLELCVPPPAGFASADFCVFDPLDETSDIIVAGEVFWWLASAVIDAVDGDDGRAGLTLGIEGTFGGAEAPVDGQQISFARVRVRVDTPVAGTYTVTYPYGTLEFEVAPGEEADGINYTADIGAANFLDPAAGFRGALFGSIGPFLTWDDYENNTDLQVLDGDVVVEQYVGHPGVPMPVVGSPIVDESHASGFQNYFRITGPDGFDEAFTDEFSVMGKVYVQQEGETVHFFPEVPLPKLYAVGPVNRVEPFVTPTTGTVTGIDIENYPVGYPIWYQENIGTIAEPVGGLKVTLCDPGTVAPPPAGSIQAMCISDPIDLNDPDQVALRTGGEGFWWSAGARAANGDDDFELVLGLEATFGGSEALIDGQQITFGRERIRIDTNVSGAGTYRITHPYAQRIFEDVPADDGGINATSDIGISRPPEYLDNDPVANPVPVGGDPDGAMIGAIFSDVGPLLLKWTTFSEDPLLTDPRLVKVDPVTQITKYFVGDPAIEMTVTGSPIGVDYFRVEKLTSGSIEEGNAVWQILDETSLFAVSGQVFDPTLLGLPPEGAAVGSFGVFRNGTWYLDANGSDTWDAGTDVIYSFGLSTDLSVTGDWDGDGTSQIGTFRNGTWYIDNGNGAWDAGVDAVYSFGQTGDLPVTGDWNGDNSDQISVFRNGTWYLDADGNGAWDAGLDAVYSFGQAGDQPVVGDWNGDGTDQIGVFRNGTWYLDADGNGTWDAGVDTVYNFGQAGDQPVVGDWNGDGTVQIGVFRNGTWYLDADGNGAWEGGADSILSFGMTGDSPVVGNW